MQLTKSAKDISEFKLRYEKISGLEIPNSFFQDTKTYVFQKKGKIIGGFVISNKRPLRTLQLFTSNKVLRSKINRSKNLSVLEVCCLWIDKAYRKNKLFSAYAWFRMAIAITTQKERFVIYGTNSKGLAKMYGYPKNSILICNEIINDSNNYVFLARRSKILFGIIEIIISKFKGKGHRTKTLNDIQNQKSIFNELSI